MSYQVPWGIVHEVWAVRPCTICRKLGFCRHREPEFDLAELFSQSQEEDHPWVDRPSVEMPLPGSNRTQ